MRHIGFTGTRHGMTDDQRITVMVVLRDLAGDSQPLDVTAHHGDCVGADSDFHDVCKWGGYWMVGHLPIDSEHRAFCTFDETRLPLKHMQRNAQIVKAADVMLACPYEMTEQERGGTWRTIGMTRKAGKPLAIIWPDGSVTKERWV